jgi:biopolymer transport protein ExbD
MSRRSIKKEEDKADINISPMIDMVFILLIFFIVTTVFVEEQGVDADRPQPSPISSQNQDKPITIHIASNGVITCNTQEIQAGSIRSKVSELLRQASVPVIIEVEEKVVAGRMITVIDEAKLGGADKVLVTPAQSVN